MPLAAQAAGLPVITSRFGAMADYTMYGVSVPPLAQQEWLGLGFVPTPNATGIAEALREVYDGQCCAEADRQRAHAYISRKMSVPAVASSMWALVERVLAVKRRKKAGGKGAKPKEEAQFVTISPSGGGAIHGA